MILTRLMTLDRCYPFDIHGDDNHINYGEKLLLELDNIISVDVKVNLDGGDYNEALKYRTVEYVMCRLITLGNNYYKKFYTDNDTVYETELTSKISNILDADEIKIDKIVKLVKKICDHYQNDRTQLTNGQKKKVREFAKENMHKCYICGRDLDYSKSVTSKRDGMEIEHIFPRVYGGGRDKSNIASCCENCNKLKDDKISFSNTYFESFVSSSEDHDKVKKNFCIEARLAMLMMQDARCFHCGKRFFELDHSKIYLQRKNEDDIYHFLNCYFYCEVCHSEKKLDGIEFDVQIFLGAIKNHEKL